MNNSTEITFVLDSREAVGAALGVLLARFRTLRDQPWTTPQTYLDTFDWRLYRYGGTFSATALDEGFLLEWRSLDGALRRRSRTASLPEFAADLRATNHDDLAAVIDVRRLLPIVHEELQGETVSILDRREKTGCCGWRTGLLPEVRSC